MVIDVFSLFLFGVCGWLLAAKMKIPVAPLIGPLLFIGLLRGFGLDLPQTPLYFAPLLQILLGIGVGNRFDQDIFLRMKELFLPCLIIIIWALFLLFFLGWFLSYVTYLDPVTAFLSSSIGGFPEMTVIAMSVDADLGVVLFIHLSRLLVSFFLFPIFIQRKIKRGEFTTIEESKVKEKSTDGSLNRIFTSLLLGSIGGFLFLYIGVPAGGMVGSMLFVTAGNCLGLKTYTYPSFFFNILLMGIGIMASDNISQSTLAAIASREFFWPFFLSLFFTFSTSIMVAHLISHLSGWDKMTCLMAAAPAGLTTMTLLAIKYQMDPLRISMLHLCRLMLLKTLVPLLFLFFY